MYLHVYHTHTHTHTYTLTLTHTYLQFYYTPTFLYLFAFAILMNYAFVHFRIIFYSFLYVFYLFIMTYIGIYLYNFSVHEYLYVLLHIFRHICSDKYCYSTPILQRRVEREKYTDYFTVETSQSPHRATTPTHTHTHTHTLLHASYHPDTVTEPQGEILFQGLPSPGKSE